MILQEIWADSSRERMVLPLWRSLYSLNLMLPKEERKAMLLRLFDDDTPLIHMQKRVNDEANGSSPLKDEMDVKHDPDMKMESDVKYDPDLKEVQNGIEEEIKELADEGDGGVLLPNMDQEALKKEDAEIAELENDAGKEVESFVQAGDEVDAVNTTI